MNTAALALRVFPLCDFSTAYVNNPKKPFVPAANPLSLKGDPVILEKNPLPTKLHHILYKQLTLHFERFSSSPSPSMGIALKGAHLVTAGWQSGLCGVPLPA